jgi:hypothetical protein
MCKSIGICIAWKIQTVLSAFASALAGGLVLSRAMLLVFYKGKKDHGDTMVDERRLGFTSNNLSVSGLPSRSTSFSSRWDLPIITFGGR